ncbi:MULTISPECIES: ribonuclease R [unclassified Bartonella]|uniref:ribonuclease R n=1 Tax=unclassified Bartonella TaxID=2645622 RepID=UPI000999D2D6|nr:MULTISPECIES: ribonuclease R [unclassified Bartonella]AQX28051.1 RNAse R [Bartonella sp. JB15]AQX29326.1 RNAse R [Bartonella sp. JB63]
MAKSEKKTKYFQLSNIKRLPNKSKILPSITNNPSQSSKQKNLIIKKALPPITLVKVSALNKDGDFIAKPVEWPNDPKPNIRISSSHRTKRISISIGDHVLVKIFRNKVFQNSHYTGRIIRKIDRKKRKMLGIVRKLENGEWQLDPIERKNNELIIDMSTKIDIKAGDLVEVEIKDIPNDRLKYAKIRNILGHIDNETELSMIALISKEIPYIFSSDALDQAKNLKPDNTINREDWRQLSFITIDPPDAKDHDDAVYAIKDESPTNIGGWIINIAIADVSCYIKAGSTLDQEALKRGNSVYFPDCVIPMLPEHISNDLCSLHEGKDRPALAVRMIFDANGNKRKHSFHRIVMRTAAKLSYQEVQCAIEGNTNKKTAPLLKNILQPLWDAYSCLKIARNHRQPLELEVPETKIILDQNGYIKDVMILPHLEAHRLIEEFMIQANIAAAETLKEYHQPFIYRIHDRPSLAKQKMLQNFLKSLRISTARGTELTSAQLNNILIKVMNTQQQELVNQVILRSQSQAEYNPKNIGHFGLNLHNYTHFTSPIRRYADLIIHRALIKALQLGNDALTDEQEQNLAKIATQISLHERRAIIAERETVDRLVAHYLANKIGHSFGARVSGVIKAGLFIALDKLNVDGFVPIATLKSDYYYFDEVQHALIGKRSRKCYQLGDIVEVKILEVQPFSGSLYFEMLTKPRQITFSPISYKKNKSIVKKRNHVFDTKKTTLNERSKN